MSTPEDPPPGGYGQYPPPGYGQDPPPGYGQGPGYGALPPRPRNGFGVAALVLGVLALVLSWTIIGGIVPGVLALIFGLLGLARAKRGEATNSGLSVAGAVIGVTVGYWVGKRYGERLLSRLPNRILDEDKMRRAEETVRRYGGRGVFVGRFTAALRALVPGTAGMGGVRYGRFLAWNAAGGTIWAVAFVMIGYLAASQYQRIEKYANYIGIGLLVVIAVVLLVRHRRNKSRQKNDPAVHAAARR